MSLVFPSREVAAGMSLVFPSREVAAGPTVGLKSQVASAAEATAAKPVGCGGLPVYLCVGGGDKWRAPGEEVVAGEITVLGRGGLGLGGGLGGCMAAGEGAAGKDGTSSESSSIGEAGESSLSSSSSTAGSDGEEEEVQSKLKGADSLASLESLEESLPIKRGLSNCFSGKSKSFANLSEAVALGTAGSLAKAENPFNKRRRILMACKASWQRRASYAALNTTSNLWALQEDHEYHDVPGGWGANDGKRRGGDGGAGPGVPELPTPSPSPPTGRKHVKAFKAPRSFSLTDLRHA